LNSLDQHNSGADRAFLWIAIISAVSTAFCAGNYTSLSCVSDVIPLSDFEGGKAFAINFGLFLSVIATLGSGLIATIYLIVLFLAKKGSATSFCRISGYLLLLPFAFLLFRIAWVQFQKMQA
jgi:hypothetical protein